MTAALLAVLMLCVSMPHAHALGHQDDAGQCALCALHRDFNAEQPATPEVALPGAVVAAAPLAPCDPVELLCSVHVDGRAPPLA